MVKKSNQRIIVTLSDNTVKKIEQLQEYYDMSKSQVVQFVINEFLRTKER